MAIFESVWESPTNERLRNFVEEIQDFLSDFKVLFILLGVYIVFIVIGVDWIGSRGVGCVYSVH